MRHIEIAQVGSRDDIIQSAMNLILDRQVEEVAENG